MAFAEPKQGVQKKEGEALRMIPARASIGARIIAFETSEIPENLLPREKVLKAQQRYEDFVKGCEKFIKNELFHGKTPEKLDRKAKLNIAAKAHEYLYEHFSYAPTVTLFEAFSKRMFKKIDCDTGSLVIQEMLAKFGIESELVLVPKHGYLRINDGERHLYFETTQKRKMLESEEGIGGIAHARFEKFERYSKIDYTSLPLSEENAHTWLLKGSLEDMYGLRANAIKSLEEAAKYEKTTGGVHLGLALLYIKSGNMGKAAESAGRYAEMFLTNEDFLKGDVDWIAGVMDKGDSQNARAYIAVANTYLKSGDQKKALGYYEKRADIEKTCGAYIDAAIDADHEKTLELYRKAAKYAAKAEEFVELAKLYLVEEEHSSAMEMFSKAVELDPKCLLDRAEAYVRQEEYGKATQDLIAFEKLGTGAEDAFDIGRLYAKIGNYEKALESFERFAKLEPDSAHGPEGMALSHIKLGKYGNAVEICTSALEKFTGQADVARMHEIRAEAYEKLGMRREAAADMEKAMEIRKALPAGMQDATELLAEFEVEDVKNKEAEGAYEYSDK